MTKLLIISYDALGDNRFEKLLQYPNFSRLVAASSVTRNVRSIFPTNTYPVHISIVTGLPPGGHGITGNTEEFPSSDPVWLTSARLIRAETLWQKAAKKGLSSAAVLWPVTGGAKDIKYNIPEAHSLKGENQILVSLKAGSKLLQLREFLRHGKMLRGIEQPYLDNFSAACAADILREKSPDLALVHFTAYDGLCHKYGLGAPELDAAFEALDNNLGMLLDIVGDDCPVILFSDHAQLDVSHHVFPNELLRERGYIEKGADGEYIDGGIFVECCAGCAFLHVKNPSAVNADELRELFSRMEGFSRFLTPEEIECAGKSGTAFGFAAKPGYTFATFADYEKATHGYPVDYDEYTVFYMVRDKNHPASEGANGGSLLDIMPIAQEILSI